jgi:hypothetical protein
MRRFAILAFAACAALLGAVGLTATMARSHAPVWGSRVKVLVDSTSQNATKVGYTAVWVTKLLPPDSQRITYGTIRDTVARDTTTKKSTTLGTAKPAPFLRSFNFIAAKPDSADSAKIWIQIQTYRPGSVTATGKDTIVVKGHS